MANQQTVTAQRLRHCAPVSSSAGAVAAAHPRAVHAAQQILGRGGNAVDAAIAAQAVICVVLPHAAGLGGDMLALVRSGRAGSAVVTAVAGAGKSPAAGEPSAAVTGGGSVTVPGLVEGWVSLHDGWGRLHLDAVLEPAVSLARDGMPLDPAVAQAVGAQRTRLLAGGAGCWALLDRVTADRRVAHPSAWQQPELADLLMAIGERGADALYRGPMAGALVRAVQRCGGTLTEADLAAHAGVTSEPVSVDWDGGRAHVQPPPSQGVLLALALRHSEQRAEAEAEADGFGQHLLVELTEAAFAWRSDCHRGAALLAEDLVVDAERASRRGGPRAYLHTAGVAVADADGLLVSSLLSVFDDFGSGVFVPEGGFVLNNRAAGFTGGANAFGPARRPVHTLAPAIVEYPDGSVLALATPGADGQVQTLLQILYRLRGRRSTLAQALAAPRWRSEGGALLVESGHPDAALLASLGHDVQERAAGAELFGAVVAAGVWTDGMPYAAADWRRTTASGAAA